MDTYKINMFVIMMLMYMVPGNLEHLIEVSSSYGNMGLTGVYTDIYIKRNILYSSPILLVISYYYGYTILGLFICMSLFLSFFVSFICTCYRWKDIVIYNHVLRSD
uniref:Uncharacterized protein n=1 Tax=viral metagenome TaxID=1070528 RepID=A0A6C0HHB5_9ZZZZ